MTKREKERLTLLENTLMGLGFTADECDKLRRISNTLHRWHELECGIDGGCVERNEDTGIPFWRNEYTGRLTQIADRETGARKRLHAMMKDRNLTAYIQGDPRGAALYILRPGDVPAGESADAYYSRGICVY